MANESQFDFERTSSFSGAAWIKVTSFGTSSVAIMHKGDVTLQDWLFSVQSSGRIRLQLRNTGTTNLLDVLTNETPIVTGQWFHVAFTYNGNSAPSGIIFYINGASQTNNVIFNTLTATILNNRPLILGCRYNGGTYDLDYNGLMDEVGVWNRVLTASEIATLYNNGAGIEVINTLRLNRLRCASDY
jgi:hypothetical protein